MCHPKTSIVLTALLVSMTVGSLRAQLVADGATATINATSTNLTGDLVIGTNGILTTLIITNGGAVTNSGNGTVGRNGVSATNRVFVSGAGSAWQSGGTLSVGQNGSFNLLTVSNAATVVSGTNSYVGWATPGRGNQAFVDGVGSRWLVGGEMGVGDNVPSNQLWITRGGMVANSSFGRIGNAGSNNLVVVTDSGSLWTNQSFLYVGVSGPGNRLIVTNGGRVESTIANVGLNSGSFSNLALITGPNSTWRGSQNHILGSSGAFNTLLVSNGGRFQCLAGTIGNFVGGNTNLAVVTDTNSTWQLSSTLVVGQHGAFNDLVISNGGKLTCVDAYLGANSLINAGGSNNTVLVTGPGSAWTNNGFLSIGNQGQGNRLVISNGGFLRMAGASPDLSLAVGSAIGNNSVVVNGSNSLCSVSGLLRVGVNGPLNQLNIRNGARVECSSGSLGNGSLSSSNLAVVADSGSMWTNSFNLTIGGGGPFNHLIVSNAGMVMVGGALLTGVTTSATNNQITISGGHLVVTNLAGTGTIEVRTGTNTQNSGTVTANRLLLTNAVGIFELIGGELNVGSSTVANSARFYIGNGIAAAAYRMTGTSADVQSFANGLTVSANAVLQGNGTIAGSVTNANGGVISPGLSVGKLILSNSPSLQGAIIMEISKTGPTLTNDQFQVIAPLTYGGSLVVSNLGPTALAVGDRFPIFIATSYSGGFTNIILPSLPNGLDWANNLTVDGSIEVIAAALPTFSTISVSGTNVIVSGTNGTAGGNYAVLTATNVTTPLSNWVSLVTNQFGAGGSFSFTNAITPGELQRYYQIRSP